MKSWQRRANIAAKHEYEIAVNPVDGTKGPGDQHSPLIYAKDLRTDLPSDLQLELGKVIEGSDERIVAGWMRYNMGELDPPPLIASSK